MAGVTFICPVYNKAPHLPEVIAAIYAQTGEFARQFVFVDDGSTDESLSILQKLLADKKDTILIEQKNQGSAVATNRGLLEANMPFIKFIDADDLLAHDATALLLNRLYAHPDCVLAYGLACRFTPDKVPDLTHLSYEPDHEQRLVHPLRSALRNSLFNPTQFLARSDAVRQAGGCDERIVFSQEYSLTLRLARLGHFLAVQALVAFLPEQARARISDRSKGRQLQRVTHACAYFLRDHPQTSLALRHFALRRASGRAWRWARRETDARWFFSSPLLLPFLLSHIMPLPLDHAYWIECCARIYDSEPPVTAGMESAQHTINNTTLPPTMPD